MCDSSSLQSDNVLAHSTLTAAPRVNVVPLITPRYRKKQRTHRHIEVTDSSPDYLSPTTALQQHTREILTVHNGLMSYEQEMYFYPHELYKHGKHKIYTSAVGYSSEGDLVITREAVSEPSDVDMKFLRRCAEIDKAICLDPKARRPLSEGEVGKKIRLNAPKYRKYPGVRAPRNRKVRNRLMNDYFATEYARKLMDKYRERQAAGKVKEDVSPHIRPAFGNLPPVFYKMLDLDEDAQTRALEQYGVQMHPAPPSVPKDPDSGETRFQNMNSRLRGELIHALSSEFLTQQIDDLERAFAVFISEGNVNKSLVYKFRDGYGRLVCHGVAAYYNLVSESKYETDGSKNTVVSWPKRKRKVSSPLTLPNVTLIHMLRKKRGVMPNCSSFSTPQTTPNKAAEEPDLMPPSFDLNAPPMDHESPGGLTPIPETEKIIDDGASGKLSFYEPMCLGSSDSVAMTATQKKKMRKAMKAAEREDG